MSEAFHPGDTVELPLPIRYVNDKQVTDWPMVGTVYDRPNSRFPGRVCVVFDAHPDAYCYFKPEDLKPVFMEEQR